MNSIKHLENWLKFVKTLSSICVIASAIVVVISVIDGTGPEPMDAVSKAAHNMYIQYGLYGIVGSLFSLFIVAIGDVVLYIANTLNK